MFIIKINIFTETQTRKCGHGCTYSYSRRTLYCIENIFIRLFI